VTDEFFWWFGIGIIPGAGACAISGVSFDGSLRKERRNMKTIRTMIKATTAITPITMPASAPAESFLEVPVLVPLVSVLVVGVSTVDEECGELDDVAEVVGV